MRSLFACLLLFTAVSFSSAAGAATGLHGEQHSTNYPGNDYKNFDSGSYRACQLACEADRTCKAWTAVGPGKPPTPQWYCWLKNAVSAPTHDQCCVSGVVDHGGDAAATAPTPTPTPDNGGGTAETAPDGTTIYKKNNGDQSDANVAGYVEAGGAVTVVQCSGSWCKVSAPKAGWVWAEDLNH